MVKNRRLISLILLMTVLFSFSGCGKKKTVDIVPEQTQIRNICELATLECYYHNVAKSEKTPGKGITHWGEKKRKFWIEYSGIAKIGIDMSLVDIEIDTETDTVYVTMPNAEVLSMSPDAEALTKDSYISSEDSWINSNKITADDQRDAINEAEAAMKESLQNNKTLMNDAKERAQKLITRYIEEVGKMSGKQYKIEFRELAPHRDNEKENSSEE